MANTTRTPGRRFMKLASMTASIATKTVTNSIRNFNADEDKKNAARSQLFQDIGLQIADTLGERLKWHARLVNYNAKRQRCLLAKSKLKLKKN